MKRLLLFSLLFSFLLGASVKAATINTTGGSAGSVLTLTSEPFVGDIGSGGVRIFSVTVPVQLPVYVDEKNNCITASNAEIVNNSTDAVKITDVTIKPYAGFTFVNFYSALTIKDINSQKFSLKLNGDYFDTVSYSLMKRSEGWDYIASKGTLALYYEARYAPTLHAVNNVSLAEVVFTASFVN